MTRDRNLPGPVSTGQQTAQKGLLGCLQALITLAEDKRQCIVQGDHSQLTAVVQEEARLVNELRHHQEAGKTEILTDEERERAQHLLQKLKAANQVNEQLLKHSLSYIDFGLRLFSGYQEGTTYSRPGRTKADDNSRPLIDRKV